MKRFHLIGIGGSGLSAIALLLLERGEEVSGSDRQLSPLAQAVQQAGARFYLGHQPGNISGADVVIRSSAIPDDNVEVQAALAAGIPVLKRSDFLGQLMAGQQGVAVAGAHGKTTTTAMIAWILTALDLDPSYIIGGVSTNLGRNAHAGHGEIFVIEADEYDRMFLGLRPQIAVVTNVEHDHPDCYPQPQDFYQAFEAFVSCVQPGGVLVACSDDPGAARLLEATRRYGNQALSYGIGEAGHDIWAQQLAADRLSGFSFDVFSRIEPVEGRWGFQVRLCVPGEHNVRNALAALAVANCLGLPLEACAAALGEFQGTGRRFEIRGEQAGVTVVDDYAHHPTEIRATLAAARSRYPGRPIWAVWQPHTYSRTRTLMDGFVDAFEAADHVLVTEVYAAREAPPQDGFSALGVAKAIAAKGRPAQGRQAQGRQAQGLARQAEEAQATDVYFAPALAQASDLLLQRVQSGDVVIVLSAGDADQISAHLLDGLARRALARAASAQGEKV